MLPNSIYSALTSNQVDVIIEMMAFAEYSGCYHKLRSYDGRVWLDMNSYEKLTTEQLLCRYWSEKMLNSEQEVQECDATKAK